MMGNADEANGAKFRLWQFKRLQGWDCKDNTETCKSKCQSVGGKLESGFCYLLMVASKVCATVELGYADSVTAEEAEVVTKVKLKTGCYAGG